MTDWWNAGDRWRERQRWLPAWLDNTDWKTWIAHGVLTLIFACLLALSVEALTGFHLLPEDATGFVAVGYGLRELYNIEERRDQGLPFKPLDHVMDVLFPAFAYVLMVFYAAWWRTHV